MTNINFRLDANGINVFYNGFLVYMEEITAHGGNISKKAIKIAKRIASGNYPDPMRRQIDIIDTVMQRFNNNK